MQKSTHTKEYRALRAELRALREEAGLSQRDLAAKLGVPHSWVAKVEAGERRIDFVEFCWFVAACDADPAQVAAQLTAGIGRPPSATRRGRAS
jgi:transcriptional regulator with XRE-family HTH domain